jgi:hypothetical protein
MPKTPVLKMLPNAWVYKNIQPEKFQPSKKKEFEKGVSSFGIVVKYNLHIYAGYSGH